MNIQCVKCKEKKSDVRNIEGDDKLVKLARNDSNLIDLSPLNLCGDCIKNLHDSEDILLTNSDFIEESGKTFTSDFQGSQLQQPSSLLPESSNLPDSESLSNVKDSQQSHISSDTSNGFSASKRSLEDTVQTVAKRFKSDDLNKLFSKAMPESLRRKKFAEIQNIPKEDLEDEEVFALWFFNQARKNQNARDAMVRSQSKSHRSRLSRSGSSISSRGSSCNSFSRPREQTSPPMDENTNRNAPPARTTQAKLVDIPEDDSFYSNSSESLRQAETRSMPPPQQPQQPQQKKSLPISTKKDDKIQKYNKVTSKTNDGNAHSNSAAPRRVQIQVLSKPTHIPKSILGHKNNGG